LDRRNSRGGVRYEGNFSKAVADRCNFVAVVKTLLSLETTNTRKGTVNHSGDLFTS
jgi:hypothetical protein